MSNLNMQTKKNFILCPICYSKTRTRIRPDTIAKNLIVFCPKCKNESVVDIGMNIPSVPTIGR